MEFTLQGYFQLLFSCIEKLLAFLNVKNIVLPAAEEAESIWTDKFGFKKLRPDQVCEYFIVWLLCYVWLPCLIFWNFTSASCFSLVNIKNPVARWWFSKELRCYRKKFLPIQLLIVQSLQTCITEWSEGEIFLEWKDFCVIFFIVNLICAWT